MRVFVAGVIAILCSISVSYAQDAEPSPTPTPSQRQQRLEEEARIKKLEAEIAGYEKAIRDSIPKPTSTPRSGTASLDGVTIEPQFVAFDAASSALEKVADRLSSNGTKVVVFYNNRDLASFAGYEVSVTQKNEKIAGLKNTFEQIKKQYCNLVPCDKENEIARYPAICVFDTVSVEPAALRSNWDIIRSGCRFLAVIRTASTGTGTKRGVELVNIDSRLREFSEALDEAVLKGDVTVTDEQRKLIASLKSTAGEQNRSGEKIEVAKRLAAPVGTISGVSAGIGAVADILGYLKTDIELKGANIEIGKQAMFSEIARHFNSKGIRVLDPASAALYGSKSDVEKFPIYMELQSLKKVAEDTGKYVLGMEADISAAFEILSIRKNALTRKMQRYEKYIQELEAARGKEADPVKKAGLQKEIEKYDTYITSIDSEVDEIDYGVFQMKSIQNVIKKYREHENDTRAFIEDLSKSSIEAPSTYGKLLASYLLNQRIKSFSEQNGGSELSFGWLNIDVVSAGGNNRTRRNFFQFFSGAKIDHSGGAIFHWTFYNRDGVVQLSGIEKLYLGYRPSKAIRTP